MAAAIVDKPGIDQHLTSTVSARPLNPCGPRASLRAFRAPLSQIGARQCSPQLQKPATVS